MTKVKILNYFLTLNTLIVFLLGCSASKNFKGAKTESDCTFKNGVSLNHWTGYPIDSFTYADPKWFNKKDAEWIAKTGIDHIQLYITGTEIITIDEKIIPNKVVAVDSLISWCKVVGLAVILSPTRMPNAITDSTLTREERIEKNLKKQAVNFGVFANYFRNYGQNVRFLLNIGSEDKALRNRYYQMVLPEIRKTNPDRKLYITAYSINKLSDLEIQNNDKNIIIAAEISQSTEPKAEAVDVFAWQYQDYFFTKKMPVVTFPGTVPNIDTSMITDLGRWAIPFSNTKIEQDYFANKFKWARQQMKQYHPKRELYISHFRYWTGYPFDPKTVKDAKSVNYFISSFASAAKKNNINWCFYDYNSGSGIRNPNGEKAMILDALNLDE
jgi:hypothetical protein